MMCPYLAWNPIWSRFSSSRLARAELHLLLATIQMPSLGRELRTRLLPTQQILGLGEGKGLGNMFSRAVSVVFFGGVKLGQFGQQNNWEMSAFFNIKTPSPWFCLSCFCLVDFFLQKISIEFLLIKFWRVIF